MTDLIYGFTLKLWFKLVSVLPCSVFKRTLDDEGILIFCFLDLAPQFDQFVMENKRTISFLFSEQ